LQAPWGARCLPAARARAWRLDVLGAVAEGYRVIASSLLETARQMEDSLKKRSKASHSRHAVVSEVVRVGQRRFPRW